MQHLGSLLLQFCGSPSCYTGTDSRDLARANQRPLHGCLLNGSPQSLPIMCTASAMKYHIWTIIRKWRGCGTVETATQYWKHLFFQAWLQIMSRMMYRREAHDFIIWLHSIYLDIISNNYSRYLSDIHPLSCSSSIQRSPCPSSLSTPTTLHRKFTSGLVKLGDVFVKRSSTHGFTEQRHDIMHNRSVFIP